MIHFLYVAQAGSSVDLGQIFVPDVVPLPGAAGHSSFSRLRRPKPSLTELVTGRDDLSLKLKSFFIFLHYENSWLFTTSTTQH